MKEKIIVLIISILVLLAAIFTTIIIKKQNEQKEKIKFEIISENTITDECTEEYKTAEQEETKEVSLSEDKISSNSVLILKKYYKECGHTINEYVEMLPELVNLTEEELSDKFQDWKLINFSTREVILLKKFEGTCGEHFTLKEENGNVIIYKILADGTKQVYERTSISTEFLPETDLIEMKSEDGIQVYGIEELNKVLEDFE